MSRPTRSGICVGQIAQNHPRPAADFEHALGLLHPSALEKISAQILRPLGLLAEPLVPILWGESHR